MALVYKRAEVGHVPAIKELIKGGFGRDDMKRALNRRYGDPYNLYELIDTCALSIVALQDSKVVGFLSLESAPPKTIKAPDLVSLGDWHHWLTENYELSPTLLNQWMFVSFFCCQPDLGPQILETMLNLVYLMLPDVQHIGYFLPDSLILFPPFSSSRPQKQESLKAHLKRPMYADSLKFFSEVTLLNQSLSWSLQICSRQEFMPPFSIRKARVEDCDDLVPLFEKNHLLEGKDQDNYLQELVLPKENRLTMVAEMGDELVGFMNVTSSVDLTTVQQMYPQIQETLLIDIFCMESKYNKYASHFVDYCFNQQRLDHLLLSVSCFAPEHPLYSRFSLLEPVQSQELFFITNRQSHQELPVVKKGLDPLSSIESDPSLVYFSFYSKSVLIGYCALQICQNQTPIIDQFDVELFMNVQNHPIEQKPVLIQDFHLDDKYVTQARYILSEIMRQTGLNGLLHFFKQQNKILNREMVPVKCRRMIQYPDNIRDTKPLDTVIESSLCLITRPLILEPRVTVNARIVVVGGSDVGLSFLETLVYTSHLHFTNLVLICKSEPTKKDFRDFVDHCAFKDSRFEQLGLHRHCKIILDETGELNRDQRAITLFSGQTVEYDYLIFTPELTFNVSQDMRNIQGVYAVNKNSIEDIHKYLEGFDEQVLVYGSNLQALVTIRMCLDHGLKPENIVWCTPQPLDIEPPLVLETLLQLGIQPKCSIIESWSVTPGLDPALQDLTLLDPVTNHVTKLPIKLLLSCDQKSVDPDIFRTLNDACLVFDGGLVINKFFQTNDTRVFGAGGITKYSSHYQTQWQQSKNDDREIGESLAETLLPFFDPTQPGLFYDRPLELYPYRASKKTKALLPGGLHYLHFDQPRLFQETEKTDLVTLKDGYFRIRLDQKGVIQSLLYCGTRPVPEDNLLTLYDRHEKYYNRLKARFDEGVIPDFVQYFEEPWALALFHDRFPLFLETLDTKTTGTKEILDLLSLGGKGEDLYDKFDQSQDRHLFDKQTFRFLLETQVFSTYP
ncbi:hypothetical protein EDD86DRAFT_271972 [Gorgonomyces haynaldii]|nr:hypothetical protein EDD86DRAFT_271972 [Gorgonomyces haynaldii]